VERVLTWGIPISVLVVVAVGCYELIRHRRRKRSGAPITATYLDEYMAMFYGTKRRELEHRDSMSMMRDEEAQGDKPGFGVDLDGGVARLPRQDPA
jgi:hypothetical protein